MREHRRPAFLIAATAAMLAGALLAETQARIVHISYLAPPVQTRAAGPSAPWTAALLNAPVTEGESLRTGAAGEVEVQLECGSALRLAPNSRLTFSHLGRRDDGVATTTVTLDSGRFFFNFRRRDARSLHLRLPGGPAADVQGAARLQVRAPGAGAGSLQVTSGEAIVRIGGSVYPVRKSSLLRWTAAGAVQRLPWREDDDAAATWNRARDRDFDRALRAARMRPTIAAAAAAASVRGLPAPGVAVGSPAAAFSAWPILAGSVPSVPPLALPSARASASPSALPACAR